MPMINPGARQRGFSLIELMVGVVIGLLTVLVITQVMTLAEGKKRTVSMGSDAQVNGALALFTIQRDIQQAGYGAAASPDALGCKVNYKFTSGSANSFTLAPVVITDGGTASDSITVLQANTTGFSAPMLMTGASTQTDDHFTMASTLGAAVDNLMIAVPQTQDASHACTLFAATSSGASTSLLSSTNLPHATGSTGNSGWNASSVMPASGYPSNSYVLNMGAMLLRTYAVSTAGNLTSGDLSLTTGTVPTTPPDLYPQIVMLRAMYGQATTGTGTIDTYTKTSPTTNAGWKQVMAIRVAVVARSNQYEKDIVTSTVPQWDVGPNFTIAGTTSCNGSSKCLALDVSTLADWQHYRYKVYDTIIPLRNVLWNS